MFTKNDKHKQSLMLSDMERLPALAQKRLRYSWAEAFYQEMFCRIEESVFSVLYSQTKSRPNIQLLGDDLDRLCERSDLEERITNRGYLGETAAEALVGKSVELKTGAMMGKPPGGETIGFEEFTVEREDEQMVIGLTCPQGQAAEVRPEKKPACYSAGFDAEVCEECPLAESGTETTNRRASIESTVRSVIHPFRGHLCKMPVRGKSRVATVTVLSAAMVNVRGIARSVFARNESPSLQTAMPA